MKFGDRKAKLQVPGGSNTEILLEAACKWANTSCEDCYLTKNDFEVPGQLVEDDAQYEVFSIR